MEFPKSKFAFSVKSTSARPPRTTEPELTIIAGVKGKLKLNEAASKLLGLKPYDYIVFVSTEDQVEALKERYANNDSEAIDIVNELGGLDALTVDWAITKGWEMLDANGQPLTAKKPLTNAEIKQYIQDGIVDENGKAVAPDMPAVKGSRLSSKMKEIKSGMILEATDSTNCPLLRANHPDDMHVVYAISKEGSSVTFENGNTTVDTIVYPIVFAREDKKIEKNKA